MTDLYTKSILTVIAVALMALVAQNAIRPAGAFGTGCGDTKGNACYITTGTYPLDVHVTNLR